MDIPQKLIPGVAVVIASTGRPEILLETVRSVTARRTIPEIVVLSLISKEDFPHTFEPPASNFKIVYSNTRSLPSQRNAGVNSLPDSVEFILFIDDDMELHDEAIAEVRQIFVRNPDLAAFSGCILANGNISRSTARDLLDAHEIHPQMPDYGLLSKEWPGLYGCCMCIRRKLAARVPFDERLPLYAIGEDTEIGFRLSQHGKVGGSARCPVVHLAERSGRISEVGVGYAQIINFIYFARKGVGFPVYRTFWQRLVKLPLTNLLFACFARFDNRSNVDRPGRLKGNCLALIDLLQGKIDPQRLVNIALHK